jgi:hypothetical protein
MFKVTFQYCETSGLWDVFVTGAINDVEARQGFNAVILTALLAIPKVEANKAELQPDGSYKIIVGQYATH